MFLQVRAGLARVRRNRCGTGRPTARFVRMGRSAMPGPTVGLVIGGPHCRSPKMAYGFPECGLRFQAAGVCPARAFASALEGHRPMGQNRSEWSWRAVRGRADVRGRGVGRCLRLSRGTPSARTRRSGIGGRPRSGRRDWHQRNPQAECQPGEGSSRLTTRAGRPSPCLCSSGVNAGRTLPPNNLTGRGPSRQSGSVGYSGSVRYVVTRRPLARM